MVTRHNNLVRSRQLVKPYRCRDARREGKALIQDVIDALYQVLSGLPYVIESEVNVPNAIDDKSPPVDICVRGRKRSDAIYAIIECKNIVSDRPATYSTQLARAFRQLSIFGNSKLPRKICIVRRKVGGSENIIEKQLRHAGIELYDWSDPLDWLKMVTSIRLLILGHEKEDGETYLRLLLYYDDTIGKNKQGRTKRGYVEFLTSVGYSFAQANNAVSKLR